jgi:putative acetyltransferase
VLFYEARGFDRVGEHVHEVSSHQSTGVTGTVVEMCKDLSTSTTG